MQRAHVATIEACARLEECSLFCHLSIWKKGSRTLDSRLLYRALFFLLNVISKLAESTFLQVLDQELLFG